MRHLKAYVLSLASAFALSVILSACPAPHTQSGHAVNENLAPAEEGYIRINYLGNSAKNLWLWDDFDDSELSLCTNWDSSSGKLVSGPNGDYTYTDIKLKAEAKRISFIVRGTGTSKLTGDITFIFPYKYSEIFLNSDGDIYIDKDLTQKASGITGAIITSESTIKITSSGSVSLSSSTLSLKAGDSNIDILSIAGDILTISGNLKPLGSALLSYKDPRGTDIVEVLPSMELLDEWYVLSDSDISRLGYKDGIFTTWAPLASSAKVFLFKDAYTAKKGEDYKEETLTRNPDGTWESRDVSEIVNDGYKYYKYRFVNGTKTYDTCDIWAKAAGPDSVAAQITDINIDTIAMPSGWETEYTNPWKGENYADAIIYEMHIRDWSRAFVPNSTGKFDEITSSLNQDSGKLAEHLKELGITHVQILPMFDYAEKNDDGGYNWGYNPYHYNVPEGRYVNYGEDGRNAVAQMRRMIQAFHEAGIAVIMDVVYNHTNGTGVGSIYDMTIPGYFYQDTDYSGCGNAVATNRAMVKKYVIDSLKHWMLDYHINGFRFDLMGIHEQSVMQDIYKTLSEIDPRVMVYGEPWTGSGSYPTGGSKGAITVSGANGSNGVGAFDDDFRNAIKGGEYGGFQKGHVQGKFNDSGIVNGLLGKSSRNSTGAPGLTIHYVECHDNYTLFDKLAISFLNKTSGSGDLFAQIGDKGLEEVKKQDKLAAAYIFLAQGTPFLNGGQEFLRTKQGDENSYASSDKINQIDFAFKETYSDVYKTYKGLIRLRKDNPDAFGANTEAKAETVSTGVTKYTAGDFLVYFNATDKDVSISASGYTKAVDVSSGKPDDSVSIPSSVPAKSFVILKK